MPNSFEAREEFADLLRLNLLGPRLGEKETLTQSPRDAYLVGVLAPSALETAVIEGKATLSPEDPSDNAAQRFAMGDPKAQRGVSVEAEEDNEDETEDADDSSVKSVKKGLMAPSSMGIRFRLPAEVDAVRVVASWGRYNTSTVVSEPPAETSVGVQGQKPRTTYQREPFRIEETLNLGSIVPGVTERVHLSKPVILQVDRYLQADGTQLIELALCNDLPTSAKIPLYDWLFQTHLLVTDVDDSPVFLPSHDYLAEDIEPHLDDEEKALALQYRNRLEFAVGRTCSVTWTVDAGARRARSVQTSWLPVAEIPQTQAPSMKDVELDMDKLAMIDAADVETALMPLATGYSTWLIEQRTKTGSLPDNLRRTAETLIEEADFARNRLIEGISYLAGNAAALDSFHFMNAAMRDQRFQSQVAQVRASGDAASLEDSRQYVLSDAEYRAPAWRAFQLAFILMQIPSMVEPHHPRRSSAAANVELLFFPTGGGKTEAYLGLAAFTFAIRRLQGAVTAGDGITQLEGEPGVAVLMRYTLRLLTAQQFQRATALVCAAEMIRQSDPDKWGSVPFTIGLWVGMNVSPKRFDDAKEQIDKVRSNNNAKAHGLTVLQVSRCPWCGTAIDGRSHVEADPDRQRIYVYCGDEDEDCPFTKGRSSKWANPGLPILTVDEEIYRYPPTFLLGTVDKFARLSREGEAASLFGYVRKYCERHGYVHGDTQACGGAEKHNAKATVPAATVVECSRLRPPDLIIQDELHLIAGALGTAVGLFESVVDVVSSWTDAEGRDIRPLIIASTATVRNAHEQVRALYGRVPSVFPPQVLDVEDTFFSKELPVSEQNPGRRYIGVCAQGVRLTTAEISLASLLLLSGQKVLDDFGNAADPYMTLVGYFSATRELAGMSRYVADDVTTAVGRPRQDSGFTQRITSYQLQYGELTSRISSDDIKTTLDKLAIEFDSTTHSTEARKAWRDARDAGKNPPSARGPYPYDVVLATSMLQVGVDVGRLGLMLVVGQPKNTAEYIQASSRVGRVASKPGLVVSLGNWTRPRDLAHFEQFQHYHHTFYSQVEPLSVTPYSETSMDRGVAGLLVSAVRVIEGSVGSDSLNPEQKAGLVSTRYAEVEKIISRLLLRVEAASEEHQAERFKDLIQMRLNYWDKRAKEASSDLGFTKPTSVNANANAFLLKSPEELDSKNMDDLFRVANSMREVQPEINILVSPIKENLVANDAQIGAVKWVFPAEEGNK
ncbi:DISARM system helicase DrmA [Arthrobacter sp. zg-Y820]|uniref:DISARM system helicase DrmA n=1 Tax=unclassified Arthrobacter TaxID=235627 RepID=UPI001E4F44E2|nr:MULTISPECIES: DISARM system helicase DrmA [unclassified Arthrobacter]MCC9195307.1 DISARM system helicase DrmA [Arthrobacter sp. zg-Y820]MDK1278166.1 DISARM system helicase DrmA [Arthrobacter sp. zg.Y820]WIB10052.1 DISARM system helicase DrmA [Arthrobacter sp. zg-Y820]